MDIDPMQKGVSLFLSYTNTNKMSLHHVKEHPKISNFLQFEPAVKVSKLELFQIGIRWK